MIDHGNRSRERGKGPFLDVADVDAALRTLRGGLGRLRRWGIFPSLKLCYDDFAFDREKGPASIAADLGMTVDADEVWKRLDAVGTKKNKAVPHRWKTEMSPDDAERIAATVPNFLRLVEHGDLGWFQRIG
jgi:hypothetical protein